MRVFWRVFCGLQVLRDQYGVEMLGMCVKKVGRRTGFAIIYVERLVMGMTHCFGTIYGSRKSALERQVLRTDKCIGNATVTSSS